MVEELVLEYGLVVAMDLTLLLVRKELAQDIQLVVLVLALDMVGEQSEQLLVLHNHNLDKGKQQQHPLLQESMLE